MKPDSVAQRSLKLLLASLFAALSPLAAVAGPVAPNAGTILQQIKPPSQPASPDMPATIIERVDDGQIAATTPFTVKAIRISGNTRFDTQTLHALVADSEGKSLTLAQLEELAARITDYYHSHGQPLGRARIPQQTVHDGVLNIEVIEH
jgi:hemolysin activation/secretion protein